MRLLLIEDSKRLQKSLGEGLRRLGYALDIAGDGEQGLLFAEAHRYDTIILDLMLPKIDGLTILKTLRSKNRNDHILILTAKDAVPDKVAGLDAGADDYLPKPFEFDELVARIKALTRRGHGEKNPVIVLGGGYVLDTSAKLVTQHGRLLPSPLTAREYGILELLALHRGEVISRKDIEQHVYDERAEPMSNVVDAAICTLRRKIEISGSKSLIQTRRGIGYILQPDLSNTP